MADNPVRAVCSSEIDERFIVDKKGEFARQFGHLYYNRISLLKPTTQSNAIEKWGDRVYVCRNCTDKHKRTAEKPECFILGTVYKDMKKKPHALDKYLDNPPEDRVQSPHGSLISDDDKIVLEDCDGRLEVAVDDASIFVTGTVLAFRGNFVKGGFKLIDFCTPGIPKQIPLPKDNECKVVILSGLNMGKKNFDFLALQMMIDYLCGYLGSQKDQEMNSSVARVIVAGNSLAQFDIQTADKATESSARDSRRNTLRHLDLVLTQIGSCIPVDVMSGASDPTNFTLPQQPLYGCLFPTAATYDSVNFVTNPYKSLLSGVSVLGTSGQNVDDMKRQSHLSSTVECLEQSLHWRLVCPTAPDTLPSYPFKQKDPYVIEECPHIYFAGNQKEFATDVVREGDTIVRTISVPDFSETGSIAIVNLKTLECESIQFK